MLYALCVPVVVAGDLNVSDRTWGYRRLASLLRDAMRAGWAGPTSERSGIKRLLLRIDHIFVSRGWCASGVHRLVVPSSDHRRVTATVGACPSS